MIMQLLLPTMLVIANSVAEPIHERAAIRVHVSGAQKASPCTDEEYGRVKDWILSMADATGLNLSPSWCSHLCDGFAPGTCWVAHSNCSSSSTTIVDIPAGADSKVGVLSEMELLIPEINDSQLSGFTEDLRRSCMEKREDVLDSIKKLIHEDGSDEVLSAKCKKRLPSKVSVACVRFPSESIASQYETLTK